MLQINKTAVLTASMSDFVAANFVQDCIKYSIFNSKLMLTLRGNFKAQPAVGRQFRPVLGGCHISKQNMPSGTRQTASQPGVAFSSHP